MCQCLNNELGNDDDLPNPETVWTCAAFDPACPTERPRIGSGCGGDGAEITTCTYDGPCGISLECVGGVWLAQGTGC